MGRNINVHVFNLNKQITQSINSRLELYDLTRSEIPYITILYQEENVTQEYLSKVLDYNEGTVTRALKRLEKKGFVERIPSLQDRRKKIVCLTEEGLKKLMNFKRFVLNLKKKFSQISHKKNVINFIL
ncbi:MAG: MarR family transcriptional regulator [archaeon]|nr:MarR family transcriptional regulator [archaeon]